MFTKTLFGNTKKALAILGKSHLMDMKIDAIATRGIKRDFVDAEISQMPRMLKPCNWQEVKKFFEDEVKKIAAKFIK